MTVDFAEKEVATADHLLSRSCVTVRITRTCYSEKALT